jgi:ABC-type molybdate transport system substrate-binding protein
MGKKDITRARDGGSMANAVKLGSLDAAIVWNAVVFSRREALDAVPIEPSLLPVADVDAVTTATYGTIDMSSTKVQVMTLKGSRHIEAARKLVELVNSERGRLVFAKRGFSAAP